MAMDTAFRRAAGEAARQFGYPEAHVLAVAHVEGNGQPFATVDGDPTVPLVRFEGHIFLRRLSGAPREAAVKAGLAKAGVGSVKNPAGQQARWDKLIKPAMRINPQAALEACSFGAFQIMGFHWEALGYASVEDMVARGHTIDGQIEMMLRYVRANGLDDELIAGQWPPFARGYNGKDYAKNRYDVKLAEAAALYGGAVSEPKGMLRMGAKGRRVRELQALLVRAGYVVKEDGDFGPTTRDQLKLFQTANGLKADGIYGPATEAKLAGLRQAREDVPGHQSLARVLDVQKGLGGGLGGAATIAVAKETLEGAAVQIASVGVQSQILDYVTTGLTVGAATCAIAGLVYAGFGWLKSKRTVEA